MPIDNDIPDFSVGEDLTADDMNAISNALRTLQQYYGDRTPENGVTVGAAARAGIVEQWLGKTTSTAPSWLPSAPTLGGDARYWVTKQIIDNSQVSSQTDQLATVDDKLPNDLDGSQPVARNTYCATSIMELPATGSGGTHNLPEGTRVQVFAVYSRSVPAKKLYFFTGGDFIGHPQYQYQVLTGVQNGRIWDFVRAHPAI